MPDNRNRKRPIQVKFFVNATELELIKKRMTDLGMDNLSAYLRNMALGNTCENQKVFYGTHPAIITQEVFDKVQEIRQQRHRRTATGKSSIFSGLVFCEIGRAHV